MVRRKGTRRSGKLSSLADALGDVLGRSESRTRVKEKLAALVWPECVGDFYAERTAVTRVHRGIMFVWCISPALAHQLSLDTAEIARRINVRLEGPYVREIRPATTRRGQSREGEWAIGPPRPLGPSRDELAGITLTEEEVEILEAEAAMVEGEDLRERFRQAAYSDRKARKWRAAHGYRKCPECGWEIPPTLQRCTMCDSR